MTFVLSDELFDAQMLRALGHAPYEAADIGECIETARRITHVDADLWYAEWMATAERIHALADSSAARGAAVSARGAYFRASNYYRTAGIFLLRAPIAPRLLAARRLEVETFRRGAALLENPPDVLEIPFEDYTLPAYFFRAKRDGARHPTVILTGGYDSTVEENYFANGAAALQRGYNVLAFDGPGQGSVIIEQGIPFRADWETVVRVVVDYALTRPEVDKAQLALMGWSFGGYLAPRAATGDHRLAACVSDCGPYDLYEASVARMPAFVARQMTGGNALGRAVVRWLLGRIIKHPSRGWALRRNLLVHGLDDPMNILSVVPDFTLKGRAQMIQCPTFVCTAEHDDLSLKGAPALYEALTCPKQFVMFKAADGAGDHCETSARTLLNREVFDWLDEVLANTNTTAKQTASVS